MKSEKIKSPSEISTPDFTKAQILGSKINTSGDYDIIILSNPKLPYVKGEFGGVILFDSFSNNRVGEVVNRMMQRDFEKPLTDIVIKFLKEI